MQLCSKEGRAQGSASTDLIWDAANLPAIFAWWIRENLDKPINETRDLGYMLYDLDFDRDPHSPSPLFFRAYMDNGVIITDRRQVEVRG